MDKLVLFHSYCQKVLPAVFNESLSYYEDVCKLIELYNKVAEATNNMIDAFEELKDYVINYLDSQNFQELVNNKLEEMAEDGTLADLINNVILAEKLDTVTFEEFVKQYEEDKKEIDKKLDDTVNKITSLLNTAGNITYLNQIGRIFCDNVRSTNDTPYLFQGGCITNDGYAVLACRSANENNVDLYRVNLSSGTKQKYTYTQQMGHANSIAYNPDKGIITVSDTVFSSSYHEISYPSMTYVRKVNNTENATWLWYNRDEQKYYCGQSGFVCELDDNYTTIKKTNVNKPISATGQTGMVVDGIYYHLNYNPCVILMYDFETGEFIKCLSIADKISSLFNVGEPEWIDYYNGKWYCGCTDNGADTSHNPTIHRNTYFDEYKNIKEGTNSYTQGNDSKVVYVSGDFIFNPDGSQSKPFYSIREAALLAITNPPIGIEIVATKEYVESYDIILKGSLYYAVNTVAAHPSITFNGDFEVGRGTVIRMKNAIFSSHCKFIVSSGANIFLDTKNNNMFPNGVDMTVEGGSTITGTTKIINDIFKSGNTHAFQGCAINCTNIDYPIQDNIVDRCPTFTNNNFTKNFPILAGKISNTNNSFTCPWFPNEFYIKWGNETFKILRNVSHSKSGYECTGSNDKSGNLEIKQLSMQIDNKSITDFSAKLFTDFNTGSADNTEALIIY